MSLLSDLQQLPSEVKSIIFGEDLVLKNQALADKFYLNQTQLSLILNLENFLFLKKLSPLDLPTRLEEIDDSDYLDLRALALDIAINILWPIQDYLGNVDRLILRLGGKVPKAQHLPSLTLQKKSFPSSARGTVAQFLAEYDDFKDLRVSAKKIISPDGHLVMPSVDNWLKDYVHYLGAGYHNSLQRVQYLSKGPNTKDLSETERESLRVFLLSYDDKVPVDFVSQDGIVQASLPQESKTKADQPLDMEQAIANLQSNLASLDRVLLPENFILSEAQNDIYKVRDILWNALGMNDKEKVLSCLKVLITRKAIDTLIKEDTRFKSILKRFIGVRYGNAVSMWFDENQDKLLARRLFLELILVEKLRLADAESAVAAFYMTSQWPQSGQVTYLDQKDAQLKWRNLQVIKNQLSWLDN